MQGNWSDVSASTKEPVKDPEDLPPLIIVRNESLINTGATQSQHKLPLIGDKLFVRKITIRPGRIVQELNMPITTYEERGLVQASANGCNVSIAARRFRMQTVAMSVVAVSTEQGEPRIRICGRHRLQTIVVAPYNVPAECHDLQRGEKIEVKMYSPQVNSHMAIHENYCLPPNSPMASDEKKTTSNIKFIAGIARWNVQENGIDTFTHPFANLTQLDLEKIRHYENFMLSAAARAHEQKVSEMRRAAHTGKLTPVDNGEVQFVTDRCFNDDDWAIRSKLWKDDAIVMISPAKGENANQPVGIAQLTTVEADEDERTFTIQLRAEPLGSGDRDIEPDSTLGQIVQGKLEARISFSEGNTQFKRLMDVHQQCSITSAFKNRYPAQHPLAVMLGISHLLEPPKLKEAELKADNSDLNEEQLQSLLCTLRGQPLTFTGASAGTGREWYILHEGVLLIVAPSNNATTNIVKAFVKCTNPAADEFLVIQSNAYNRSHAGKMETCFEESRLLATVKRVYAEQEASMEEPEKEAMLDYISRSESGMAFHVPDGKALTFVIKHRKPRVIFCTLGMLHRCHGKLAPFVTGVAVDEAAVLSEQEMTTMMAMLPNVSTVSFVGDSKQAKSHDFDVPDGVREYGLFPVTDVVQARGIPKIDLKYTYRFGKAFLEKLVSPACYDGVLQCGADDERHQKFFDLRFNGISPRLPAVVFNTDARDVRNLAKSRHNEKQRNGAIRMAESIQKQQADAQIAILTYYAAEAEACQEALEQRRLKGIEAFTVDKFQGRETDYALVLLSRAHNEEEDFDPAKFKFVLDPNRATVAVTRCRQGMFIFGQVSLLKRNVVWNRFLSALQPHSSVLELENLADLLDVQVK